MIIFPRQQFLWSDFVLIGWKTGIFSLKAIFDRVQCHYLLWILAFQCFFWNKHRLTSSYIEPHERIVTSYMNVRQPQNQETGFGIILLTRQQTVFSFHQCLQALICVRVRVCECACVCVCLCAVLCNLIPWVTPPQSRCRTVLSLYPPHPSLSPGNH